jgi:hypothetical protein
MRPTAYNENVLKQIVLSVVAVRMKITTPALQEMLGMLSFAARLVLIENDRVLGPPFPGNATCSSWIAPFSPLLEAPAR